MPDKNRPYRVGGKSITRKRIGVRLGTILHAIRGTIPVVIMEDDTILEIVAGGATRPYGDQNATVYFLPSIPFPDVPGAVGGWFDRIGQAISGPVADISRRFGFEEFKENVSQSPGLLKAAIDVMGEASEDPVTEFFSVISKVYGTPMPSKTREPFLLDPGLHQDPSNYGSDPTIFGSAPPSSGGFIERVAPTVDLSEGGQDFTFPSASVAQESGPPPSGFARIVAPAVTGSGRFPIALDDSEGGQDFTFPTAPVPTAVAGFDTTQEIEGQVPPAVAGFDTTQEIEGQVPPAPVPTGSGRAGPAAGPSAAGQKPSNLVQINENIENRGAPLQRDAELIKFYPQEVSGAVKEIIHFRNPDGSEGWLHMFPPKGDRRIRKGLARG